MSACSQCGTVANATDRFCNVCGTPLARPSAAAPAAYPQAAPAQQAPSAYPHAQALAATAMAPTQCPMGHEIPPGAIYCAHGHALSLDPAPPPQAAYGAAPPQAYPVPQPQPPPVYVPQPPQPAYQPPPQAYAPAYAPSPAPYVPPGYGAGPPREAPMAPPAKVLRGFLVAYTPNPNGDFWPLTGGRLVVGRLGPGDGVDITLQDPTISSRHGVITVDAASGAIVIEDTGSTNGTFVNDEHIGFNGRRELRDGDRLRLGGLTAIVKVIGRI